MRLFSNLMSWSNKDKSCIGVGELTSESLYQSFVKSNVLVKREQECISDDKS